MIADGHPPVGRQRIYSKLKYLFVMGCPRSGTTAMVHLLNADERIFVGMERYKYIQTKITPNHFAPKVLMAPKKSETNLLGVNHFRYFQEKWDSGNLRFIGDKVPGYFRQIPYLRDTFPGAQMVFLLRDLEEVANSFNARAKNPEDIWPRENDYRKAVSYWNSSILHLKQSYDKNDSFIAPYEKLFSGDLNHLESLYRFLDLDLTDQAMNGFEQLTCGWEERRAKSTPLSEVESSYLEEKQSPKLKKWILQKVEEQLDSV